MRSAAIRSGTTVTTPDNRERSEGQTCFTALLRARERWAPTREKADKLLDDRLAAPFTADANDTLYQWDASRRLQPVARPRAHSGSSVGYQFRGRRAQSARDGNHGP